MKTFLTIMTVALLALVAGSAHATFATLENGSWRSGGEVIAWIGNAPVFDSFCWDGVGVTQQPPLNFGGGLHALQGTAGVASADNDASFTTTSISSTGSASLVGDFTSATGTATAYTEVYFQLNGDPAAPGDRVHVWITGTFSANAWGSVSNGPDNYPPTMFFTTSDYTGGTFTEVMNLLPGDYYVDFGTWVQSNAAAASLNGSYKFELTTVPEPISMVMLGCLGAGMAAARKLRRRK